MARNFRAPGRLMFLRPVKTAAQEKVARRTYDAVWIKAEVSFFARIFQDMKSLLNDAHLNRLCKLVMLQGVGSGVCYAFPFE